MDREDRETIIKLAVRAQGLAAELERAYDVADLKHSPESVWHELGKAVDTLRYLQNKVLPIWDQVQQANAEYQETISA